MAIKIIFFVICRCLYIGCLALLYILLIVNYPFSAITHLNCSLCICLLLLLLLFHIYICIFSFQFLLLVLLLF